MYLFTFSIDHFPLETRVLETHHATLCWTIQEIHQKSKKPHQENKKFLIDILEYNFRRLPRVDDGKSRYWDVS